MGMRECGGEREGEEKGDEGHCLSLELITGA